MWKKHVCMYAWQASWNDRQPFEKFEPKRCQCQPTDNIIIINIIVIVITGARSVSFCLCGAKHLARMVGPPPLAAVMMSWWRRVNERDPLDTNDADNKEEKLQSIFYDIVFVCLKQKDDFAMEDLISNNSQMSH